MILRGADIEALDGRGETPLSIAVRNCSYNSLETLLENGCEIEKKDLFGFNVIDKARMRGFDSLRLFLEKKAEERKEILEKRLKEGKKLWDLMKFDIRFSWEENDQVFKEIVIGRKIIRKNPIIYPFNDFKGLYNVSILQEFDD